MRIAAHAANRCRCSWSARRILQAALGAYGTGRVTAGSCSRSRTTLWRMQWPCARGMILQPLSLLHRPALCPRQTKAVLSVERRLAMDGKPADGILPARRAHGADALDTFPRLAAENVFHGRLFAASRRTASIRISTPRPS